MGNSQISQKVADLIHVAFKHGQGIQGVSGIVGASQSSEHVRQELMRCAIALRQDRLSADMLSHIDATVRTATAMGYMTTETQDKIQDLLGGVVL